MPVISVAIPTYRASQHLLLCARSLAQSEQRDTFEVCIYGDGGGEESKHAIAECEHTLRQAGITSRTLYNPQNLGNTAAVNAVARMATSPWMLVVNDDMVFPSHWASFCLPLLKPGRVLSLSCIEPPVGGHEPSSCFYRENLGLDPNAFDFQRFEDFAARIPKNETLEVGVNYPFFVERSLFECLGGVDERFSGPYHDPDLFLRFKLAGAEMVRTQSCALYHFSGVSLRFEKENKKRRNSLKWIEQENRARILFIEKWGAKPRARFGSIPRTKSNMPIELAALTFEQRLQFKLLLLWERLRALLRTQRYRALEASARCFPSSPE